MLFSPDGQLADSAKCSAGGRCPRTANDKPVGSRRQGECDRFRPWKEPDMVLQGTKHMAGAEGACAWGSIPRLIVMPSIVTRALLPLTLHNHALTVAAREGTGILKTGRNGRMRPFFYLSLLAFLLCCWYTGTGAFTFVNKAFCQPFQRLRGQGAEPPPLCVRSGTPSHTNGQGRNDL